MVRLTDRPDMTLYVYRGRKTTIQQQIINIHWLAVVTAIKLVIHLESVIIKNTVKPVLRGHPREGQKVAA